MRSNLAQVRNPLLALPATQQLLALPADQRLALAALLMDFVADAQARGEVCWRQRKPPMAAYWKACGVIARHCARLLRNPPREA